MTCVWDSLIKGLKNHMKSIKLKDNIKITPINFVCGLKQNNTRVRDILINNTPLTEQEIEENFEAIRELNVKKINDGYYCSTSDPVLILVCHLFKCSINHHYNKLIIHYNHSDPLFVLDISSSARHMMFKRIVYIDKKQ